MAILGLYLKQNALECALLTVKQFPFVLHQYSLYRKCCYLYCLNVCVLFSLLSTTFHHWFTHSSIHIYCTFTHDKYNSWYCDWVMCNIEIILPSWRLHFCGIFSVWVIQKKLEDVRVENEKKILQGICVQVNLLQLQAIGDCFLNQDGGSLLLIYHRCQNF